MKTTLSTLFKLAVETRCIASLLFFLCPLLLSAQDLTVCRAASYSVPSAVPATGASSYQWLENGAVIPSATGMSYTNAAGKTEAGTYVYVRRAYVEDCEEWQNSNDFVVHVLGSMPVIAVSASSVCQNGNVVFTASGGGTGATYTWSGATGTASGTGNCSYTVSGATTGTKSVSVYSRVTAGTVTCQSANAATVTAVVQALPTVSTTSPVARCGVGAVTLSASAAGGTTTAMTYIWKVGAAAQITTAASSYTAPDVAVGSTTYSVTVRNDNGCVSSSAAAGTITVTAVPTITLTSGSSVQTVILGTAITQVKYTTANASSVTVSNLPSGVTGAWASNVLTISGTPTAAGVNGYTVTTANGNSCSNTTASGAIVAASGFSSSSTWSYASLAWSDVVVAEPSNCTKTNTFSLSGAPTQYKVYNGRYYYTWACATGGSDGGTNAELCPSPWRLPTKDDFINLDKAFGGSGSSRSETRSWIDQYYVANWGADYGGYGSGSSINNVKSHGYYWSSTETRNIGVYILFFVTDGSLFPNYEYSKYYGLQVRCVK